MTLALIVFAVHITGATESEVGLSQAYVSPNQHFAFELLEEIAHHWPHHSSIQ